MLEAQGEADDGYKRASALAGDWALLLQNNHTWGDGGSLYFTLPAGDLAESQLRPRAGHHAVWVNA